MFFEYIINYNDKDPCKIHWNNLLDLQKNARNANKRTIFTNMKNLYIVYNNNKSLITVIFFKLKKDKTCVTTTCNAFLGFLFGLKCYMYNQPQYWAIVYNCEFSLLRITVILACLRKLPVENYNVSHCIIFVVTELVCATPYIYSP